MKKGEKISTDSLEENGWVNVCNFMKGDLQVWANGTLRIIRRVKNELVMKLYDRKDYRGNLTKQMTEEELRNAIR